MLSRQQRIHANARLRRDLRETSPLDLVRQEPGPSGAVIQGLFFGRIAPHRSERHTFQTPALVLGHHRDPVHPFSDAGMLAKELPNGRLLEADSLVELRLQPERLTDEIAAFLDEVWGSPRAVAKPAAKRAAAGGGPVKSRVAKSAVKSSSAKRGGVKAAKRAGKVPSAKRVVVAKSG